MRACFARRAKTRATLRMVFRALGTALTGRYNEESATANMRGGRGHFSPVLIPNAVIRGSEQASITLAARKKRMPPTHSLFTPHRRGDAHTPPPERGLFLL